MTSWKSQFLGRKASFAAATGFMIGLPSALPLMAQQQAPATAAAQPASKSEVTRQLEALYERDGRPMPQMVIPRYQPQSVQGQPSPTPGPVQPTAGTEKKGLLYRLLPSRLFRDRSRQDHTVPSHPPVEPPTTMRQPSQQPAPLAQQPRLLPGTESTPRAMPQQQAASQQPAPMGEQTLAPAAEAVADTPATQQQAESLPFLDLSPAPPAEEAEPVATSTKPEVMIADEPIVEDPIAEFTEDADPEPAPAAATAATAGAADPFDNLFPEEAEEMADETTSPYTGLTLDEDPYAEPELAPETDTLEIEPKAVAESAAPAMPADDAPFAPPVESDEPGALPPGPALSARPAPQLETPPATEADNAWQQSDPVRSKMDRIAARHDATGLKGFCPVMLRDHRELVDAREPYRAHYKGHEYLLSSAEAVASFQVMPAAYAPALGGNDVIHYAHTGEYLAGSLDHAVWYKGRLYMFASAETQEAFAAAPSGHATEE
ncbi:YHS domain protein [Maioricimonas rarisocia]|uniref:YHS domain protein n=1 Tax=Maioricimonas rarisocia TaxID=2528026 RepID=A0A517Z3P2_9PLAN|nr:hypothetical protein [Maioricimonas rarisocia]QDU37101.1 YHS domain protein [Maioricimonas rarisocia]